MAELTGTAIARGPVKWLAAACIVASILLSADASFATDRTPVMQRERLTADQLAVWYQATAGGAYHPDISVDVGTLARLFIEEGQAEGVAGDLAFAQSILETGWFSFPSTGQVRATDNNFAGIGAVDGGDGRHVATFRSARIGVRAQIQHLRAYADPTVADDGSNLAHPLESPRFHLVSPKGRAPFWQDLGGVAEDGKVNWASDPEYSDKILRIYRRALDFHGLPHEDSGLMWLLRDHNSSGPLTQTARFGTDDGQLLACDWNGDGRTTVGEFRGGHWYLATKRMGGTPDVTFRWGASTDTAICGDWNGDGVDTIGLHRGREWLLRNDNSRGGVHHRFSYGRTSDTPVVGDWNGDGITTIGVHRGREWILRNHNSAGPRQVSFKYGRTSDTPVVGDWNGEGTTTIGVIR